jgi:glycosyltransferase involved in cell wall biosynthesis
LETLEPTRAPFRLGVLSTHLIQYFSPLYRHLAKRVAAFEVGYFRQVEQKKGPVPVFDPTFGRTVAWDVDLVSGYDFVSFGLPNAPFSYSAADLVHLARGVAAWQGRFRPDVAVLPGWTLPDVTAAEILHRQGVRLVFRPEGRVPRGGTLGVRFARDVWCRSVLRLASAGACVGMAARDELLRLGMPPERLAWSPYVIDTDLWGAALAAAAPERDRVRASLGFADDDVVYLYVGKLLPVKRVRELLEVFVRLAARVPRARLLLVGDGEQRAELEERARSAGVAARVTFAGFQNQTELPKFYVASDVFTLMSIETWGLVVNEAVLAGLPVALSVDAGSARDLVVEGVTGSRLYVEHTDQVVAALERLADPALRAAMKPGLARLAERYTLEAAASGLVQAAAIAMSAPR